MGVLYRSGRPSTALKKINTIPGVEGENRRKEYALTQEMLTGLPGWNSFGSKEQYFLSAMILYNTETRALKHCMLGRDWLWKKKKNPVFVQAMEERWQHQINAAMTLAESAAVLAVGTPINIMKRHDSTDADKLKAADQVLKLNRMYPGMEKEEDEDEDVIIEVEGWLGGEYDYLEEVEGTVVEEAENIEGKAI